MCLISPQMPLDIEIMTECQHGSEFDTSISHYNEFVDFIFISLTQLQEAGSCSHI
jgi:hypothetical protein